MKLSISDSQKQSQERAINSIVAVNSHKIADSYYKVADAELADMHKRC